MGRIGLESRGPDSWREDRLRKRVDRVGPGRREMGIEAWSRAD